MNVDMQRLEAFMGKMIGHMTGGLLCYGIWLGDELGLYRALAGKGAIASDELATATGCHPRLVREWLDGQAAGGLVRFDGESDRYELTAEAALALADERSPVFVARSMNSLASLFLDLPKIAAAFRGDGGLGWGEHHACLFKGTEWFFRTGYRAYLTQAWIPALEGVEVRLQEGARVADVGCGHGASLVVMAEAYPRSRFHGFDVHAPSIETSRKRAVEAGVAERVELEVATATSYGGAYDLICYFDCLHDMGDPVAALRHARERLAPGGTILLVEPFAVDGRAANIESNPLAAMFYTSSACICTPGSLSQEGRLGLGAQAGEGKLRELLATAGFGHVRRAAQTPTNLILEARV